MGIIRSVTHIYELWEMPVAADTGTHTVKRFKTSDANQFGSDAVTAQLFGFYEDQLAVLGEIEQVCGSNEDLERISTLHPLLFALCDTAHAVLTLSLHQYLNETFMLARAFLECLINYCYLLVCDQSEYDRFIAHTRQKGFRALRRTVEGSGLRAELSFTGKVDASEIPGMQEALDLFTGKRGGEITRWTDVSLPERVGELAKRGGSGKPGPLMLALLAIYQDASEALHGTLYGSVFHCGVFQPGSVPASPESLKQTINQEFSMILLLLGIAIDTLVAVVSVLLPVQTLLERSSHNVAEILKAEWLS